MNKVFIEDLPRWEKGRKAKEGTINWFESIAYKVKFIYDGIEGEVEIVDYKSKGQYLFIKYLDQQVFKIQMSNFLGCNFGNLLGIKTKEFKIEIGQIFKDDKRNLTIIDREYRKDKTIKNKEWKYYKYHCNKCGFDDGWMTESNLLKGIGCSCCAGSTVVENINSIVAKEETQWMIKYFQGGYDEAKLYTKSSGKSIYPICPDCGRIRKKKFKISCINTTKSIGCSCGDGQSYPFKFMFNILEQLSINFETEFTPEWIKPKRYDFYLELNNKKYIIEMDGGLGHGKKVHNKDTKTIEETQQIDDYKDRLADEHNIEVIRINSDESDLTYIKNNILDKLSNLFDLSNIDWLKAEEFALSNLVKKVCEIKRDITNLTTTQISNIMKLSKVTISKYLKQGTKLGWCNYNPKYEKVEGNKRKSQKRNKRNLKLFGKPVEIFKDGISLGKFESCSALTKQFPTLFGQKIPNSYISLICRGIKEQYEGYTFKFI